MLGITESDFHRTRLTHSLEVAQISRGIVYQLLAGHENDPSITQALPDVSVMETIGFSHDLGHPPFGHSGETALNFVMRADGGFEGNGQSLRLITHLELHTHGFGLDLTRRTLLGVLKYPASYSRVRRTESPPIPRDATALRRDDWKPPKCYLDTESDVVEWILDPLSSTDRELFTSLQSDPTGAVHGKTAFVALDTSIMELGDDIAYGTHDFEDAVALEFITRDHWTDVAKALDGTWAQRFALDESVMETALFERRRGLRSGRRKQVISSIINALVCSVRVEKRPEFESPLLRFRAVLEQPARKFLQALMDAVFHHVVRSQPVQTLEYRGRHLIVAMFEALESDWEALINPAFRTWIRDTGEVKRGVCDYVAGMTDAYATRVYERLFVPRQGTVFERL